MLRPYIIWCALSKNRMVATIAANTVSVDGLNIQ